MTRILKNLLPALAALTAACSGEYTALERQLSPTPENIWLLTSTDSLSVGDRTCTNVVELDMARNDVAAFQIVLNGEEIYNWKFVEKQPSEIRHAVREIAAWNDSEDILVPASDTIRCNGNAKLWISHATTPQTKPGLYEQILKLQGKSSAQLVKISIRVHDVLVPEIPSIPAVFGINPKNMELEGMDAEQIAEYKRLWSDLLLNYRISPYFSEWMENSMKVENTSSPYAWNDPRTVEYLKDPRFTAVALPCHSLSDNDLGSMLHTMRNAEVLGKSYFYVWDEPKDYTEYAHVIEAGKRIHALAPDARVMTTFYCGPQEGKRKDDLFAVFDILRGAVDIYVTGVWSLRTSEERADSCRQAVRDHEQWWSYVCMADSPGLSIKDNSRIQNRATLWRSYKEQPKGFLYWVVNSYGLQGAMIPRTGLPHGDGILVLPGKFFGTAEPLVVSARLERWRDGAIDYELLRMVEQQKGRDKALELLAEVYTNPLKQTNSPEAVNSFRKKLLEQLGN